MEQLPLLASSSKAAAAIPFYLALDHRDSTPPYPVSDPSGHSNHERGLETINAKIMSHRLYPALVRAFIDCRKVGAPPEVVGRLSSLADELKPTSDDRKEQPADPELDQFMETYCDMLVMYRQELTRPIQEADEFFRSLEAQMDSSALVYDNSCQRGGSSEDEQETGDVAGLPAISGPSDADKELKNQLLNKYSGNMSNLWGELSKKKKKGKLPRDARQKLLQWWQLHYRWPYPSELEKEALAESTGLDGRQINNWFINQRKRHWKPPPAAAAMDNRLQPTYGASSSSSAVLCMEGQYFTGGNAYPRGGP